MSSIGKPSTTRISDLPPPTDIPSHPAAAMMNGNQGQGFALPSRDFPKDSTHYTHDEETHVNHIPKSSVEHDYVGEDDRFRGEESHQKQKSKKYRRKWMENAWEEFQIPILVGILYFLFQTASLQNIFRHYVVMFFPSFYTSSGTWTTGGMLIQSIVFGGAYWSVVHGSEFLGKL